MYCPKCLNSSLCLKDKGVVQVIVNKKQMDSGRFLYNFIDESKEEILASLESKVEEYFKWYSSFSNKEDIQSIELVSNDINCENGCSIGINKMFSVINLLISSKSLHLTLQKLGKKYSIDININV